MRHSLFAAIVAGTLAVFAPAYAADPQTFKTEDSATKFCKPGNVAWFTSYASYAPPSLTVADAGNSVIVQRELRILVKSP
jgi:hypothetical protein